METKRLGADGRAPHGEWAGGQATEQATGQVMEPGVAVRTVAWELAGEVGAAARARVLTRRALGAWRAGEPAEVDDVVLMVDELVTNAVVHGTGPVRLRLHLQGRDLVAEVGDDSPLVPRPRRTDPDAVDWSETGRGLLLVAALSAAYGTRPCGPGKVVWFRRPLRCPVPSVEQVPDGQSCQEEDVRAHR